MAKNRLWHTTILRPLQSKTKLQLANILQNKSIVQSAIYIQWVAMVTMVSDGHPCGIVDSLQWLYNYHIHRGKWRGVGGPRC